MATDKIPVNKLLKVVADPDDTDTDNSALYYSAIENSSSSVIYHDESTLEAEPEISLEKTLEKTVKQSNKTPMHSPAVKKMMKNSPMIKSGRKIFGGSSTPHHKKPTHGHENDINFGNKTEFDMLTIDLELEQVSNEKKIEIVNQHLEQIKLELPTKPNWRFTSPSNPAYEAPENDKSQEREISPGQIQFEKTANRVDIDFEDLSAVLPPDTGRASMAIDDFKHMKQLFKVKTPAKTPITVIDVSTEPEMTPEEVKPPKTLEEAFENMAAGMANSSIDEIIEKSEEKPKSNLPKRTSISTAYRKSVVLKSNSVPSGSQIPAAAKKRATWASRQATYTIPEVPETKQTLSKKWSPKVDLPAAVAPVKNSGGVTSRRSYLPTSLSRPVAEVQPSTKKRQSLHPAALKPSVAPQKPKPTTSLKIATVKVGNRRSSFGNPVGKPNIRKSMLPSRASPKPVRRSVMPPPSTLSLPQKSTGAIPKQTLTKTASKSDLMCKYCDKKFAIAKGLDDHLLTKCPKIPPKDKKKLLSQNYHARELEVSRKTPRTPANNAMDSSEASVSSSGGSMPPPTKHSVPKSNKSAHTGVVHTPNKMITCMACGLKFASVIKYTVHMTSVHFPKENTVEIEENGKESHEN